MNFAEKVDNSDNIHKARSIEDFQPILKGKVYVKSWKQKTSKVYTQLLHLNIKSLCTAETKIYN